MYKAKFISETGELFDLSVNNYIVFDIEGLSGVNVEQTFSQSAVRIGESISAESIGSITLTVTGTIYKNRSVVKREMLKVFSPPKKGKLIFNDLFFIDVAVKKSPTVSPIEKNGKFSFQLVAPYPFFKKIDENVVYIGKIEKKFKYPTTLTSHTFATKALNAFVNVVNLGDKAADFKVVFSTSSVSENPYIANLKTFEILKINRTLNSNEQIEVFKDENGILKANLIVDNVTTDIFADIDENSNLFELYCGENLILASDDNEGKTLTAFITFNEIVAGVVE